MRPYSIAQGALLNVTWQPGWEGGLGEDGYMCLFDWVSLLCTRNYHGIVYQLSAQFSSRSVVSDSLRPRESQHARPPCPSPTPGVHPNPRPPSRWCHPAVSSSVVPFSSCAQSLPASGLFPMSQLLLQYKTKSLKKSIEYNMRVRACAYIAMTW